MLGCRSSRPSSRALVALAAAAAFIAVAAPAHVDAREQSAADSGYLKWPGDLGEEERQVCLGAERAWKMAERMPTRANLLSAIEKLQEARKAARTSPLPLHYLGIAYQFTGDFDDARRVLKQAIDIAPKAHETVLELADNYCHLKKYRDAARWYDKTMKLAPRWAEPLKRRAILLHVAVGDVDAALADVDAAAQIDPRDAELPGLRANIKRAFKGPEWSTRFEAESKHYRISTNVSQEFADLLSHRAELIHKLYRNIFGEDGGKGRKFPIIVYGSKQEYHANGGPAGAGGHYSPQYKSLELFRYPDKNDTLLVLHHEGFHQFLNTFIHDAPQWFNEGTADYFGPSKLVEEGGKEYYVTQANPWRLKTIKRAIRSGAYPAIADLMLMSQQEMYSGDAGLHYAMAWSLIYFCCERRDERGNFVWFPVLRDYFKELKKNSGRTQAFAKTFGKIDLSKFEDDWKRFILGVRD